MQYIDVNGKSHKKWHKAVRANIKAMLKPKGQRQLLDTCPDGDRYQVPESYYYEGNPVPPVHPIIQTEIIPKKADIVNRQDDVNPQDQRITKIEIDYTQEKLCAIDQFGNIIRTIPIDSRLLCGITTETFDMNIQKIGLTEDEMRDIAEKINSTNESSISKLVAAASDKNCLISPTFSQEFIDCASQNISMALHLYPMQSNLDPLRFFRVILEEMEKVVNKRLKQDNASEE